MKRHIRNKHPDIYDKEQMPMKVDETKDTEEVFILEYVENEIVLDDIDYITTTEDIKTGIEKEDGTNDESGTAILVSKRAPIRRGWLRKYMQKLDERRSKCLICSAVLKLSLGSYGNMKRHIEKKHPDIFKKELQTTMLWMREHNISIPSLQENESVKESSKEENESDENKSQKEQSTSDENNEGKTAETATTAISNALPKSDRTMRFAWAKNYCKRIDDEQSVCVICSAVLRMRPGMYGNMKRHIRRKHPHVYEKELGILSTELKGCYENNYV